MDYNYIQNNTDNGTCLEVSAEIHQKPIDKLMSRRDPLYDKQCFMVPTREQVKKEQQKPIAAGIIHELDKGNGSDTLKSFFQSEPYRGPEKRSARAEVSQVEQILLDSLRDIKRDVSEIKACKDDCNLGELQPHIGHITDVIKEKGNGDIGQGITNGRDENQQLERILNTRSKVIDRAIMILVGVGIMYAAKQWGWV